MCPTPDSPESWEDSDDDAFIRYAVARRREMATLDSASPSATSCSSEDIEQTSFAQLTGVLNDAGASSTLGICRTVPHLANPTPWACAVQCNIWRAGDQFRFYLHRICTLEPPPLAWRPNLLPRRHWCYRFWCRPQVLDELILGGTVITGVLIWPSCVALATVLEQRYMDGRHRVPAHVLE